MSGKGHESRLDMLSYEGYMEKLCTRTRYESERCALWVGGRVHEAPIVGRTNPSRPEQPIRKRRTRRPDGPAPGVFLWVYSTHFKARFSGDWSNPYCRSVNCLPEARCGSLFSGLYHLIRKK